MHGCDHTRAEFSTRTKSEAAQLIALGLRRMSELEARATLRCERVIVFPQGIFSGVAMRALRESELLGAVNTELLDCQSGNGVSGAELLKPAVTSYSGFPLFLRRPAEDPLANFALDILLGKPVLIVTHHQYFQSGMQPLISKIESLKALNREMIWTSLESGIAGTYSVRQTAEGESVIRLFSPVTKIRSGILSGPSSFIKSEPLSSGNSKVFWNGRQIQSVSEYGDIKFSYPGTSEGKGNIEIAVSEYSKCQPMRQSVKHRIKVASRRYLSEFRDNYCDKSPGLKPGINLICRLIRNNPVSSSFSEDARVIQAKVE